MPSMFQDVMGDLYFSQNQQINNAITLEIMYEIKILLVLIEDLTLMTQFEMTASFYNTIQFKSNQNTLQSLHITADSKKVIFKKISQKNQTKQNYVVEFVVQIKKQYQEFEINYILAFHVVDTINLKSDATNIRTLQINMHACNQVSLGCRNQCVHMCSNSSCVPTQKQFFSKP
eukprot:TRINITY_DN5597_c0_g1_i1.p4 TRINITY_DN5597_c0_g1~~TRINITY_DN5597_c0_g1_i1.p4  ORF type:complete len:174 (+),score=0.90 TRINITY_DN5597_c0_g1_i1:114-635(+)